MPDRTCITMSFPNPLFFRYHLPLMVVGGGGGEAKRNNSRRNHLVLVATNKISFKVVYKVHDNQNGPQVFKIVIVKSENNLIAQAQ